MRSGQPHGSEREPTGSGGAARRAHLAKRVERFGRGFPEEPQARQWARRLPAPLPAPISRRRCKCWATRTADQRKVEAAWPDLKDDNPKWPFDTACPELREGTDDKPPTGAKIDAFKETLAAWRGACAALETRSATGDVGGTGREGW